MRNMDEEPSLSSFSIPSNSPSQTPVDAGPSPSGAPHRSGFASSPNNGNSNPSSTAASSPANAGTAGFSGVGGARQLQQRTPSGHSRAGAGAGGGGGGGASRSGAVDRPEVADLAASREAEVRYLTPPVLLLLRGLIVLKPNDAFAREASWVYPCLTDLVVVRSLEVRAAVRELLSARIAGWLRFPSVGDREAGLFGQADGGGGV